MTTTSPTSVRTPAEVTDHIIGVFRRITKQESPAHRTYNSQAEYPYRGTPNRMYVWESELAHLIADLQCCGTGMVRSNTIQLNQFINSVIVALRDNTNNIT